MGQIQRARKEADRLMALDEDWFEKAAERAEETLKNIRPDLRSPATVLLIGTKPYLRLVKNEDKDGE
jgi:hypothetical protein